MSETEEPLLPNRTRYERSERSSRIQDGAYEIHQEIEIVEEQVVTTEYGTQLIRERVSRKEKGLFCICWFFILVLMFLVGYFVRVNEWVDESRPIPLPDIPVKKNHTQSHHHKAQCKTANCNHIATEILKDVDLELDPCDNFYAYTCKRWQANHTLTHKQQLQHQIRHHLTQILTQPTNHTLTSKLQDLYQSCLTPIQPQTLQNQLQTLQDLFDPTSLPISLLYLSDLQVPTLFGFEFQSGQLTLIPPSISSDLPFDCHYPTELVQFEHQLLSTNDDDRFEVWSIDRFELALPQIEIRRWFRYYRVEVQEIRVSVRHVRAIREALRVRPGLLRDFLIWKFRSRLEVKDCVGWLSQVEAGLILSRSYLMEQSVLKSRRKVEELTGWIVERLKERLSESSEMIRKLDKMVFEIGVASARPNVLSESDMEDYFKDLVIHKSDFLGNMMRCYQHASRNNWKSLVSDQHPWNIHPQSLEIQYDVKLNKVIIPAGLLQSPYFDPDEPLYLYIGTLGWMIAREIMRGFDKIGRQYDDQGRFRNWLPKDLIRKLDEKYECLSKQYGNHQTVDDSFVDQTGGLLIESLSTYNMSTIPLLNNQWTKEQLAYIQLGRMECSTLKGQSNEWKVNFPLMNSPHFSKVFQCKKGSFMNPNNETCNIW